VSTAENMVVTIPSGLAASFPSTVSMIADIVVKRGVFVELCVEVLSGSNGSFADTDDCSLSRSTTVAVVVIAAGGEIVVALSGSSGKDSLSRLTTVVVKGSGLALSDWLVSDVGMVGGVSVVVIGNKPEFSMLM